LTILSIYDESDPTRRTACRFLDLACTETPVNRKAILALGAVLRTILLREAGNESPVTFRGALLTKVLQKSLIQTDSRVVVLTSTSTSNDDYEQTMNTLRFMNHLLARPGDPVRSPFSGNGHVSSTNVSTEDHFAGQEGKLLQEVLSDPRQRLAKVIKSAKKERRNIQFAEAHLPRSYDDPEDDDAFLHRAEDETIIDVTTLPEDDNFSPNWKAPLRNHDVMLTPSEDHCDIEPPSIEDENTALPLSYEHKSQLPMTRHRLQVDKYQKDVPFDKPKNLQSNRYDERGASMDDSLPLQKDEPTIFVDDHNSKRVENASQLLSRKSRLEPSGFDKNTWQDDGRFIGKDGLSDDLFQDGTIHDRNGRLKLDENIVDEEGKRWQLESHGCATRQRDGEVVLSSARNSFSSRPFLRSPDGDAIATSADHVDAELYEQFSPLDGDPDERSNQNLGDGDCENLDQPTDRDAALSSWNPRQSEVLGPIRKHYTIADPNTNDLIDQMDERDKSNYRYDLMEEGLVVAADIIDTHIYRNGSSTHPLGRVTEDGHQLDSDNPTSLIEEAIIDSGTSLWHRVQPWEPDHPTPVKEETINNDGTSMWNHVQPWEAASAQANDHSSLNLFSRENRHHYMKDENIDEIEVTSLSSVDPEIQSLAAGVDRLDRQLRELGRKDTFDEEASRETDIEYTDETKLLSDLIGLAGHEAEIKSTHVRDPLNIMPQTEIGKPSFNYVNARTVRHNPGSQGSHDGLMNLPEQLPGSHLSTDDPRATHVSNSKRINRDTDDCDGGSEGQQSLGDRRRKLASIVMDPLTQRDSHLFSKGLDVPKGNRYNEENSVREVGGREPDGKGSLSFESETSANQKPCEGRLERARGGDNQPTYSRHDDVVDGPRDNIETVSNLSSVGEDSKEMSDVEHVRRRCEEDVDADRDQQSLDSLLREMQSSPDDFADPENEVNKRTSQTENVVPEGAIQDHTWNGDFHEGLEPNNHHFQSRTPITRNTSLVRTSSWYGQDMRKDVKYDLPPDSPPASSGDFSSVENVGVSSSSALPPSYALMSSPSRTAAILKPNSVGDLMHESHNHSLAASSFFSGDIHSKSSDGGIMQAVPTLHQNRDVSSSRGWSSGIASSGSYNDHATDSKLESLSSRKLGDSSRSVSPQHADYSGDEKRASFEKPLTKPTRCTDHPDIGRSLSNREMVLDFTRYADKNGKHDLYSIQAGSSIATEHHTEDGKWNSSKKRVPTRVSANQDVERALFSESNGDRSIDIKRSSVVQPTRRDSALSVGTFVTEGSRHLNNVLHKFDDNEQLADRPVIRIQPSSDQYDSAIDGRMQRAELTVDESDEKWNLSSFPPEKYVKQYGPGGTAQAGESLTAETAIPIFVAPMGTDRSVGTSLKESGDDQANEYFNRLNRSFGSGSIMTTRTVDDDGGPSNSRESPKKNWLSGSDDKCLYEIDELEAAVDEVRRTNSTVWQASLVSIENLRKFQASQQAALMSLRNERDEAIQRATLLQAKLGEVTEQYQHSLASKKAEIEKLGSELSEVKSVRKEVVKIAEEAISTQAELEAKLSELQVQLENSVPTEVCDSLRRKCDVSRIQLESTQKQFTKMKEAVNEQKEALMAAKEELAIKGAENRELELDLSVQKDNNRLLQRQLSTFKELSDEDASLMSQQLIGLSKELKAAKERAANLEDENGRMAELHEKRTIEQLENRDTLESELRKKDAEACTWTHERKDLFGEIEKLTDLVNKHDRGDTHLRDQFSRLEDERNTLHGRLLQTENELENRIKDITELSSGVEQLLAQKEEDRQKVSDMEASLASFQETTRSKVQKVVRHRKEAAALLDKTIVENKSLESTNESLKETIEQLQRELLVLRSRPPTPPHLLNGEDEERDRKESRRGLAIDTPGLAGRPPRRTFENDGTSARPPPRGDDGRIRQFPTNGEVSGGLAVTTVDDMVDLTAHLAFSARRGGGNGNHVRGIYSTIFTLDEAKDDELSALKRRIKALERQNAPYVHLLSGSR
jgi:hypothetical protein